MARPVCLPPLNIPRRVLPNFASAGKGGSCGIVLCLSCTLRVAPFESTACHQRSARWPCSFVRAFHQWVVASHVTSADAHSR
eukprot:4816885-Pyramimonas_sp.AAC.1